MRYRVALLIAIALAGCHTGKEKTAAVENSSATPSASPAQSASSAAPEEYPQPEDAKLRSFIELARKDIALQKAALIADNMTFTDSEAAEFWPIYREYESELYTINSRKLNLVRKFLPSSQNLTDDQAKSLAKEAFDVDEQRVTLKKKYFSRFQEAIPATKAARFFQIENQLNMVLDLRLAASLPLIK